MADIGRGSSVREAIVDLRQACGRRIHAYSERSEQAAASFRRCLKTSRVLAQENLLSVEKIDQIKDELRELEADLSKALSVKSRNESSYSLMKQNLAKKSDECEKIKKILSDKKAKVNEYTAIIANNSCSLEGHGGNNGEDQLEEKDFDVPLAWYQKVHGLKVVGGDGVKFIFNKINPINPEKEYSFIVRLEDEKYRLLQCDPQLQGTDELLKELNESNGLFRFVRIMRENFVSSSAASTVKGNVSSPVATPPVESSPVVSKSGRGKKGKKSPPSSVRSSTRLRGQRAS